MPLVNTADLLADAVVRGAGLGAFNVVTLEHGEAIVDAAEREHAPVVLQVSERCIGFHGGNPRPLLSALGELARDSAADVSLHLDHIETFTLLESAADTGVSSVMFDASRLDYSENVRETARAGVWIHEQGWHLEAEIGRIGGKDGVHAPGARTDPLHAREFAGATGADSLAVAVGNSHAMVTATANLDHELISRLASAVPVPLVLHGSSGVSLSELARAVVGGMVKINVGTALNASYTRGLRAGLSTGTGVDPRAYIQPARRLVSETVSDVLRVVAHPNRRAALA